MSNFSDYASPYDSHFFDLLRKGSQDSAQVIVPILLEWIQPESVIDIGCGDGTWLSVFQAFGVKIIQGIDGDYVAQKDLRIPVDCFTAADLKHPLTETRSFDLVVCLEVAEHLPADFADQLVQTLIKLGPVVLFSAAIPYQGGTEHINEQWPLYWIRRFEALDYAVVDALRPIIWDNPKVEPWYAQNCLLFVQHDLLVNYPKLQVTPSIRPLNLVHPKIYLHQLSTQYLTQDVEILDLSLSPNSEITTGNSLVISINYCCHRWIDTVIFCISISNKDDVICLDTHSDKISLPLYGASTRQSITLTINRLDLSQGQYFVNVGVYSPEWEITHDFHWQKYPLNIINSEDNSGIMHPPLFWETPNNSK